MTAATSSTALATIQPAFTDAERLALAGFLAGYRGLTREAYTLELRQFTSWCRIRSLAGVPLRDVQEAASHADPRTTMRLEQPGRTTSSDPPGRRERPGGRDLEAQLKRDCRP
jgi:hypothetical protein